MEVWTISFEDRLSEKLKQQPTKSLSDSLKTNVEQEIRRRGGMQADRQRRRFAWKSWSAAVAAIILVAFGMLQVNQFHWTTARGYGQFRINVSPNTMQPTPLDTKDVQQVLKNYLERHSISDATSSSTTSSSDLNVTTHTPIVNHISNVAIRWSQLANKNYGFAIVTYLGNHQPQLASFILHKSAEKGWSVAMINNSPSQAWGALSKFQIYPMQWGGSSLAVGQGKLQFNLLAGLVIDESVTSVNVTSKKTGITVNVPVVNGVFGYATISDNMAFPGPYSIKGYNRAGKMVAKTQ